MKFKNLKIKVRPEQWAAAIVKNLGPNRAAEIAKNESREFHGNSTGETSVNPEKNRNFYLTSLNWILKRHPKALEEVKNDRQL